MAKTIQPVFHLPRGLRGGIVSAEIVRECGLRDVNLRAERDNTIEYPNTDFDGDGNPIELMFT